MLPSGCLRKADKRTLITRKSPIAVEGFSLHLAWHERRDGDLAVQHVAEGLRRVISEF